MTVHIPAHACWPPCLTCLPAPPTIITCSEALAGERAKRQELQEALQQVVLNRAAAELEAQQAAEAEAAVSAAEEVEMEDAEAEEDAAEEQEEEMSVFQHRVVVLGRLAKPVSTAERAGEVVVVRPSPPTAQVAPAPTPAREVVVLPASARKTPAPSALKRGRTPAPSAAKALALVEAQGKTPAAKGATPAPAAKAATPAVPASASAHGRTPATGGMPKSLPKSMLKEAPGGLG